MKLFLALVLLALALPVIAEPKTQTVTIKLLDNIYNPVTKTVVLSRNTVLSGTISSADPSVVNLNPISIK